MRYGFYSYLCPIIKKGNNMKFFIITDYSYNVEERITTALFNADFSGGINKDNVKKYLEKHIDIFQKRALWKFDINKTLKFISEKVTDAFAHDYTNNIIDIPELSYRIICIDTEKSDTVFYKSEIKTEEYLIYFTSNCGYNIIGNDQIVNGASLSAFTKDGVDYWEIEKTHFHQYIDCSDDIDDITDLLFFDNEKRYIKVTSGSKVGEFLIVQNYTNYFKND